MGTKAQVLKAIKYSDLGETKCSEITSHTIVSFARDLNRSVEPQTCGNYFTHLSNIFTVARLAWGYPLSRQAFDDAVTVVRKLGLIRKAVERERRPALKELDRLMEHFGRIREHAPLFRTDAKNRRLRNLLDAAPGRNHAVAMGRPRRRLNSCL